MKTGFKDLDEMIHIVPGDLVVIGSRPAMGKSSLARNMYLYAAENGAVVDAWHFDGMPGRIRDMLLSQMSGVEMDKFRIGIQDSNEAGRINGIEYQQLIAAQQNLEQLDIEIMNSDINGFMDWVNGEETLAGVVVIDYIQLVAKSYPPGPEIASILKKIKEKAIRECFTAIVLSQVSRSVEERGHHRPYLHDLSDTSELEEIADKVLFLLRRDYYDPLDKPGMAEIIVAKNRSGKVGSVNLAFMKECTTFADYKPASLGGYDEMDECFLAFNPN